MMAEKVRTLKAFKGLGPFLNEIKAFKERI